MSASGKCREYKAAWGKESVWRVCVAIGLIAFDIIGDYNNIQNQPERHTCYMIVQMWKRNHLEEKHRQRKVMRKQE